VTLKQLLTAPELAVSVSFMLAPPELCNVVSREIVAELSIGAVVEVDDPWRRAGDPGHA
jgi:hypothetical protein